MNFYKVRTNQYRKFLKHKQFFTSKAGFTLIELLIIIAIIGVLATVVVLVLNPVKLLRKSRDESRKAVTSELNNTILKYQVLYEDYPLPTQNVIPNDTDAVTGETILTGRDRTSDGISTFLSTVKQSNYFSNQNIEDTLEENRYTNFIYYYNNELDPALRGYTRRRKDRFLIYVFLENIQDEDCLKWKNPDGSLSIITASSGTRCIYIYDTGKLVSIQNP